MLIVYGTLLGILVGFLYAYISIKSQQRQTEKQYLESTALFYASEAWNSRYTDPTQALRLLQLADSICPSLPAVLEKVVPVYSLIDSIRCYHKKLNHVSNAWINIGSIAYSRDGTLLLTASEDSTVKLWNAENVLLQVIKHPKVVHEATFTEKQNYIISNLGDEVLIWDFRGNLKSSIKHADDVNIWDALMDPNENIILTNDSDGVLKIYNLKEEKLKVIKHSSRINRISFLSSGDSTLIFTTSENHEAEIWDQSGRVYMQLPHEEEIVDIDVANCGNYILTASADSKARIWNTQGKLESVLSHQKPLINCFFINEDKYILTCSEDSVLKLWDALTYDLIFSLRYEDRIKAIVPSPDNALVFIYSDSSGHVLNLDQFQLSKKISVNGEILKICFSPTSKYLLTVSGDMLIDGANQAKIWDIAGKSLGVFKYPGYAVEILFSPDEKNVVLLWENVISQDNGIYLFETHPSRIPTSKYDYIPLIRQFPKFADQTLLLFERFKGFREEKEPWKPKRGSPFIRTQNRQSERHSKFDYIIDSVYTPENPYVESGNFQAFTNIYFPVSGETIVTFSQDSSLIWWNKQKKETLSLKIHTYLPRILFSPSEDYLLIDYSPGSTADSLLLFDSNGQCIFATQDYKEPSVVFNPNEPEMLIVSNDSLFTFAISRDYVYLKEKRPFSDISHIYFNPSGSSLFTLSKTTGPREKYYISEYHYPSLKLKNKTEIVDIFGGINLSFDKLRLGPRGDILFQSTPVKVYNHNLEEQASLYHDNSVQSATFSSMGDFIITSKSSVTATSNHTKIWNLSGDLITNYLSKQSCRFAQFSEDGNYVLTIYDTSAETFPTPKGVLAWLNFAPIEKLNDKWRSFLKNHKK